MQHCSYLGRPLETKVQKAVIPKTQPTVVCFNQSSVVFDAITIDCNVHSVFANIHGVVINVSLFLVSKTYYLMLINNSQILDMEDI